MFSSKLNQKDFQQNKKQNEKHHQQICSLCPPLLHKPIAVNYTSLQSKSVPRKWLNKTETILSCKWYSCRLKGKEEEEDPIIPHHINNNNNNKKTIKKPSGKFLSWSPTNSKLATVVFHFKTKIIIIFFFFKLFQRCIDGKSFTVQ